MLKYKIGNQGNAYVAEIGSLAEFLGDPEVREFVDSVEEGVPWFEGIKTDGAFVRRITNERGQIQGVPNAPSFVIQDALTGLEYYQLYLSHDQLCVPHRENGPAEIIQNGELICESFYRMGQRHNEHAPSKVVYSAVDGFQYQRHWFINGTPGRLDDGPLSIVYDFESRELEYEMSAEDYGLPYTFEP